MRAQSLDLRALGRTHPTGDVGGLPPLSHTPVHLSTAHRPAPSPRGHGDPPAAGVPVVWTALLPLSRLRSGPAYCSLPCRRAGRARSLRAAGQRHQQSPEGRLDHRDRQRAYRARCRARVTHQPSPAPATCGTLSATLPPTPMAGVAGGEPEGSDVPPALALSPALGTRCACCGRRGLFLRWAEAHAPRGVRRGPRIRPGP